MSYKLSVIIPAFNAEHTLERAVSSVEKQGLGFENIQLIIADDASSDGTSGLCDALAAEHENITALHMKENGGPGAARNAALDIVEAPYVMFLDSDDVFAANACEALVDIMHNNPRCGIAGGDFRTVVYDENGREKSSELSYVRFPSGEYDLTRGITPAAEPFLSAFWCKLYRMDIINKHSLRMRERSMLEELMFLCRYLGFCETGFYIKEVITDYAVRSGSLSRTKGADFFITSADCIVETARQCDKDGKPSLVADYLSCSDMTGEHIDWLLAADNLTDEELTRALAAWKRALAYCGKYDVKTASPAARLLMADAASDSEAYEYDALALREYAFERRRELEGIFSSNTWKLARAIQKLSRGAKG